MIVGAVVPNEGETTPTEIAPGASVPIDLRLGTGGGGGEVIKYLHVEGQTVDGLELNPAEVVVYGYILATLTAHPQSFSFIVHEAELSAPIKQTVVLADLWPGGGMPIKSITSTLGDKLRYQLVPARGEIEIGSRMLHKRYDLELSLTLDPTKTAFDHTVTITADHPKAKPVEVRLFGKIIPRCRLDTDSISFCGAKPGEQIVRRIEYHYRDASDREIKMVKAPDCLSVSVSEIRDGLKEIKLTCTLPDCESPRADELRFEYGRDKRCAVLPVFLSCRAK